MSASSAEISANGITLRDAWAGERERELAFGFAFGDELGVGVEEGLGEGGEASMDRFSRYRQNANAIMKVRSSREMSSIGEKLLGYLRGVGRF